MERIKSICVSLIVSFILTIISILFFSMLLVKTNISENMINGVIIVISSISILIGASVSAIKFKKNGWINGAKIILYGYEKNKTVCIAAHNGFPCSQCTGATGAGSQEDFRRRYSSNASSLFASGF